MPKAWRGVTLIELIIAIILIFVVIMGLSSIDIFSRNHLIGSSRRSLLQNELSHALEHMSKNIVQATGNQLSTANQPIQILADGTGFSVRVDPRLNQTQTLQNIDDDFVFSYRLGAIQGRPNDLVVSCVKLDPAFDGDCPPDVVLSSHINPGFLAGIMPENNPTTGGFYANVTDNGTTVEAGLVGRFRPGVQGVSNTDIATDNPQIQMKNRLQARNVSTR